MILLKYVLRTLGTYGVKRVVEGNVRQMSADNLWRQLQTVYKCSVLSEGFVKYVGLWYVCVPEFTHRVL
jgi:hypothetical protein